ncbi:LOW QUALITY PROTEIN: predicted protein, partial [Brucella abortus bv. 2 str. 86/8/59]
CLENSSVFIGCGYCAFPKSCLSAKTTVVKKDPIWAVNCIYRWNQIETFTF